MTTPTVQRPISPKTTEIDNQISRLDIRGNACAKNVRELRAKKMAGEHDINDRESRIEMVLAENEIPASNEVDAQLTSQLLQWEAIEEAKQSLKPKLAAAKREAADKILVGLKKPHDAIMARLLAALVEASEANAELFQLSRDLRDYEIGFRNGVCELMPTEVLGVPHKHSELAEFMRSALKAGYLKALPKELA
jgi:hypothetical protein